MIHMADAPKITTAFIRSDAPLGGLGEPCVPPLAPAAGQCDLRRDRHPRARVADQEDLAEAGVGSVVGLFSRRRS